MTLKRTPFRNISKPAKCKVCRCEFVRKLPGQKVCGENCAMALAFSVREKEARKEAKRQAAADRAKLISLKPKKWWIAKAKEAMHAYIRARDEGKQCISCDTILRKIGRLGGDYDAGHFRSVGSAKHMEFVENNIHGQCKRCNDYLAGNSQEYERRLRIRCGDQFVDDLLSDNTERKLQIDDFKQIEATYKQKLKDLKAKSPLREQ